jgi:hypothetical protein
MNDDGSVLGRLPRSRPGTRSEKRAETDGGAEKAGAASSRPAAATARAAKAAEQRGTRASRPATGATGGRAAKSPGGRPTKDAGAPRSAGPAHSAPPEREPRGDPITRALRASVKVVEGGLKLAGGITRELLRRLPRP